MVGINAAHWLAQSLTGGNYATAADGRFTSADFKLLKSLGYTYIRLPVTDTLLFDATNTTNPLKKSFLTLIDAQIQKILDAGLAVVFGLYITVSCF
jgi:hypothetical protein